MKAVLLGLVSEPWFFAIFRSKKSPAQGGALIFSRYPEYPFPVKRVSNLS
jgi:hypothetical protein